MSVVSNVVFSFDIMENRYLQEGKYYYYNMDKINNYLDAHGHFSFGIQPTDVVGGSKCLETPLFIAAFNHFCLPDFIVFLRSLEWRDRKSVQIFIKEQDSNSFDLVTLSNEYRDERGMKIYTNVVPLGAVK